MDSLILRSPWPDHGHLVITRCPWPDRQTRSQMTTTALSWRVSTGRERRQRTDEGRVNMT